MCFLAIPHGRVVVCYISSWAVYRSGAGSFSLKNFDPNLCTHVVHAYAGLDVERNTIKSLDRWQDLKDNYGLGGYEKLVNLLMISMGGWNEGSVKYSKLAASQQRRQVFAENALNFIRRYGFDGLDLDWEYPTQRGGEPNDRENFVQLVRELSQKFKKNNLLLTSTIEAKQYVIDAAYDIENLTKYLDLLHVKCYDYRGIWNQKIGFNAPLTGDEVHNVEFTIEHLLALGAPPNKLVLGLPFHGRTFIADSIFYTRIGDPAETSFSGPYTNIDGYIGYNEICTELNAKSSFWNQAWDPEASEVIARMQDGSKTKVIVYDSTRSIAAKVRYAVQKNLRGLMASSIDTDDFHGNCNAEEETFVDFDNKLRTPPPIQGKFKLLRTINNAIVAAEDEIHNS
ncbi:AAEL006147-PA [Aedes aegypti]|uniref:AAEL006147-PA n=1 Tax=Aedes aegypti TaxID=7159 RepID=Q177F4_AEDAE|nr:AAEL006147-PA [Aedes aegypti]